MKDYDNLLMILKLFQNRPHHLTKFLLDNGALNQDFLTKISESDKLSEMSKIGIKENHLHFSDISEMKKYYQSLLDDLDGLKNRKSREELTNELNDKLRKAIDIEDFEEASRIRDYMKTNNIKKK
jgi:hypothetical protein